MAQDGSSSVGTLAGAETGVRVVPLAESGVLARIGDRIDAGTAARAAALADALAALGLPGVVDIVPAYTTVMVLFDPAATDGETVGAALLDLIAHAAADPPPGRVRRFPVCYGGDLGPDLEEVAARAGLTPQEVVRLHSGATYRVACMGFAPGFGYLLGLPDALHTPRRATPRTRVPAGSVALGGAQAGIYSLETPGGWHVLGRTPIPLFDLAAPDPILLQPGDEVRFDPVDRATYDRVARGLGRERTGAAPAIPPDAPAVEVLAGGTLATVQDLGRPGWMRSGVTPGGAADRAALTLGNRLVGNDPGAAGIECALAGPTLRFRQGAVVALTGAETDATLDGLPVPCWTPFRVGAGQTLALGMARGGLRAYLCVAGGVDVPSVLGGRGTDLFGRFGGCQGRALAAGDVLPLGAPSESADALLRRRLAGPPPTHDPDAPLRATLGPQRDRFTEAGIAAFLDGAYRVSPQSDRMGVRLAGPAVEHAGAAELISEGIAAGAVQVPRDGQPIVLLAARQTIGGYPKVATVIGADLDRLGQARPGDLLRFAEVGVVAAREATLAARARIGPESVTVQSQGVTGWSPDGAGSARDGEGDGVAGMDAEEIARAWTPEGVALLVERARRARIASLDLEIASIGLRLGIRWEGAGEAAATATTGGASAAGVETVPAPLLGAFYRRSAPDAPSFVAEGERVRAGQTIGLLEVMKSYHEVACPVEGTLVRFLVEDGAFIEYGAPLAEVRRASD